MTDKQPQTCYVWVAISKKIPPEEYLNGYGNSLRFTTITGATFALCTSMTVRKDVEDWLLNKQSQSDIKEIEWLQEINSVYIHTPEELHALKAEWQREQWISVNDKSTPDYDGKYLCFIEHPQECGNVWMYQEVVECLINNWILKDNQKVTHWMPLPKPPKP